MLELNKIYNIDCMKGMLDIEEHSISLIFVDLPYGVTKNSWDSILPLNDYVLLNDKPVYQHDYVYARLKEGIVEKVAIKEFKTKCQPGLWTLWKRVLKPDGCVVLFGQDKFSAMLMMSNPKMHRYNIIWDKVLPTGFLNANRMPLRSHEDILVFYDKLPTYNPQKVKGAPSHSKGTTVGKCSTEVTNQNYGDFKQVETVGDMKCPKSVWQFEKVHPSVTLHPTQKPLDLCQYVIRTYTNKGDIVLDCCCGSGTIPLAAYIEGRKFIGMDSGICTKANSSNYGKAWAEIAQERIDTMLVDTEQE